MRIVLLNDDFPPESCGGAGIVTHNLAQELRHRGHEIFVITTTRAKSEEGEEELDSLKIFRIYSDYHERWRSWRGLINLPITAKLKKIIYILGGRK